MDITFGQSFADPRGGADTVRRFVRSAVVAVAAGALAVWGSAGALASIHAGGFSHDPLSVSASTGTMFELPGIAPGETVTRYATVRSDGEPASLRLFASVSRSGLARFLTITVTRGTGGPKDFVPTALDGGAGPGVVYTGSLRDFPRDWDDGVALGTDWPPGSVQTFRFQITLSDSAAAQGRIARADFRWEARQI